MNFSVNTTSYVGRCHVHKMFATILCGQWQCHFEKVRRLSTLVCQRAKRIVTSFSYPHGYMSAHFKQQ